MAALHKVVIGWGCGLMTSLSSLLTCCMLRCRGASSPAYTMCLLRNHNCLGLTTLNIYLQYMEQIKSHILSIYTYRYYNSIVSILSQWWLSIRRAHSTFKCIPLSMLVCAHWYYDCKIVLVGVCLYAALRHADGGLRVVDMMWCATGWSFDWWGACSVNHHDHHSIPLGQNSSHFPHLLILV